MVGGWKQRLLLSHAYSLYIFLWVKEHSSVYRCFGRMPLPLHPPSNSPPGKRENAHKGAALKPSPRLPSIVVDQGGQKKKKGSSMLHSKGFSYKDKKKKSAADEEDPCRRSRKSRTWIEETLDDRKEKEKWLIVSYEINRFWIYHSLWLLYWATIGDQGESETSATAISDYVFSLSYNKRFTYVISDAIVYHLCNDAIRFIQAVGD